MQQARVRLIAFGARFPLFFVDGKSVDLKGLAADLVKGTGVPGLAVMVLRDGKHEIAVAGRRAKGRDEAICEEDLWHIGSLTKSMTATLAARLVDRGLIAWSDTIAQVLADQSEDFSPDYRAVTLQALLQHRGGLPTKLGMISMFRLALSDDVDLRQQRRRYATAVLSKKPAFRPGSVFNYSNAGYLVVGAMLEAITGRRWEDLMAEEVFQPLGMKHVGFGPPGEPGVTRQPRGHRRTFFGNLRPIEPTAIADNPEALRPAGGVHIRAADFLTYLSVHARTDSNFLSEHCWMKLHTPRVGSSYAAGWSVGRRGILMHAGSNKLWYALTTVDPESERAAALFANSGDAKLVKREFRTTAVNLIA